MEHIVKSSLKIVTTVYSLVAIFGYTTFSDKVEGNVLRNFPSTTLLEFIKMGFAASVVVGFPLMIFPCRQSIHTLFFKQNFSDGLAPKTYIEPFTFKVITVAIVFTTMVVAILIPNVETILGLTGATMGSLICFILPAIIFMKANYNASRRIPKIVLGIGCILFVMCTYSNVFPAVEEIQPQPIVPHPPVIKPDPVLPIIVKPIEIEEIVADILNPVGIIPDNNDQEPNEPSHRHEPANPEPPADDPVDPKVPEVQQPEESIPMDSQIPVKQEPEPAAEIPGPDENPAEVIQESKGENKESNLEFPPKQDEEKGVDQQVPVANKVPSVEPLPATPQQQEEVVEKKSSQIVIKDVDAEKANQAQLLQKIKESNEVQAKLLEKQRELLEVLENNQEGVVVQPTQSDPPKVDADKNVKASDNLQSNSNNIVEKPKQEVQQPVQKLVNPVAPIYPEPVKEVAKPQAELPNDNLVVKKKEEIKQPDASNQNLNVAKAAEAKPKQPQQQKQLQQQKAKQQVILKQQQQQFQQKLHQQEQEQKQKLQQQEQDQQIQQQQQQQKIDEQEQQIDQQQQIIEQQQYKINRQQQEQQLQAIASKDNPSLEVVNKIDDNNQESDAKREVKAMETDEKQKPQEEVPENLDGISRKPEVRDLKSI